jgi:hypothetical protein
MTESITTRRAPVSPFEAEIEEIQIGQWYWVAADDDDPDEPDERERWLGCITHIGTNYAELTTTSKYGGTRQARIHFDDFASSCTYEPNARAIIEGRVNRYRQEAQRLMGQIQELSARLGVGPRQGLTQGDATEALVLHTTSEAPDRYKKALDEAKQKTLPELFKQVEQATVRMGHWMKAGLIPLRAEATGLKSVIETIESRIFNVELYVGTIEQVEQIQEGEPAPIDTPIHIFQRRAYMDEECLADYRAGGMEFKDLRRFHTWLLEPSHLNRLMPFPRSVLAFQVRRKEKEREFSNWRQYVRFAFSSIREADKYTFLYLRNGQQIFCLSTGIEFGERLFPDLERNHLEGTLYARVDAFTSVKKLVTENEYRAMVESDREKDEELKKYEKRDVEWINIPYEIRSDNRESRDYIKWSPENVHFDDITKYVEDQIQAHNRVVLVLQGLLDRSQAFHPHPPWQLWSDEGFRQALRPVYDDSRGLVAGEKPDFEAYRTRLNASLTVGSITVGQEDYWSRREAERENTRARNDWRRRENHYDHTHFWPYGNPGPGIVAEVRKISRRGCRFEWTKERQSERYWGPKGPIPCSITVPTSALLNITAYRAGDFKQFFADPRTRAEYLQWAPLLLEAEDYLAGNTRGRKR